jgi:hypothetical protein
VFERELPYGERLCEEPIVRIMDNAGNVFRASRMGCFKILS